VLHLSWDPGQQKYSLLCVLAWVSLLQRYGLSAASVLGGFFLGPYLVVNACDVG
jgi:hypothetical protein